MAPPKVNFLVIGAQKAGTTALDHYLRQHPEIGMADVKEVHYFDNEDAFAREPRDHSAYEAHFPGNARLQGEVTPIYLYWKPACERIHRYNPAMKLIAVLRDPVERAFSQWNMEFNRGDEHRDFPAAVRAEQEQRERDPSAQHRVLSYLGRGFYAEQIERFLRTFAQHQLLFLKYDDLKADPEPQLARIFDHIGASPNRIPSVPVELNQGAYSASLDMETRSELQEFFAEDIRKVERLLNWDLSSWMAPGAQER